MKLSSLLRRNTVKRAIVLGETGFPCFSINRLTTNSKSNSLVLRDKSASLANPWKEVKDPKGSQLSYYWNPETNQTTPLGFPKPQHWVEVEDPNGSSLTYWWNPDTNQTTALGDPKPSDLQVPPTQQIDARGPMFAPQSMTFGGAMKTYFLWGVGVTFAFAAVRAIIG